MEKFLINEKVSINEISHQWDYEMGKIVLINETMKWKALFLLMRL